MRKEGTIYPKNTKYEPQAITNCFNIVSSSLPINRLMPEADSSRYQPKVKFSNLFHFMYMASWTLQMKVALHCFISYVEFLLSFWFNIYHPPLWCCGPTRAMASLFLRFLDHTQQRITVSRTPLDTWSSRCRDLYLTTHNTHNRQTSIPLVGFEPTISAGERP